LKQTASTTLAPGASFNLGAIFSPAMAKDLSFDFLQFGQSQPTDGIVIFAPLTAGVTPGDFDQNGVVNGQDLNRWKTAFGTTTQANADGDNDSDGNDFLIWQRNLGSGGATSSASLAASAVPEPSSFVVVIGLTAAWGACRRALHGIAVVSVP
jgi:hypothetical protein